LFVINKKPKLGGGKKRKKERLGDPVRKEGKWGKGGFLETAQPEKRWPKKLLRNRGKKV